MVESITSLRVLDGKRVAILGKLGGVSRRSAQQMVREHGGEVVDIADEGVDMVVLGADELPLQDLATHLSASLQQAAARGDVEILGEAEFWQRLGMLEGEQEVRRLYTPAMLARMLGAPLSLVRRWHRRGLIVPACEVHRLPYFSFAEVAMAKNLAQLLAAGVSPQSIERKLETLARFVPHIERPLAQLSIIVEGRDLLLRRDEGLLEPGGQMRIDFASNERGPAKIGGGQAGAAGSASRGAGALSPGTLAHPALANAMRRDETYHAAAPEELVRFAGELEDDDRLEEAIEAYRAALLAGGPRGDICFQLAELLYRQGDLVAARERYSMAVELDEAFVEARYCLGCVLAELGDKELAAAAFAGALDVHADYSDVHYQLAVALDDLGRAEEALPHWRAFLELSPHSPWAEEAKARLGHEV